MNGLLKGIFKGLTKCTFIFSSTERIRDTRRQPLGLYDLSNRGAKAEDYTEINRVARQALFSTEKVFCILT